MNFSICRRVWETWFHLIVTAKCYSRETCIMNRTKTHERGSSCQWHFRGVGPQRLNIWTVSVSADQNLTPPCLPGKGLVLWVAPMTHPKRTAHPRHGVVSKQTYWSVPGGQNDEWMDGGFFDECHVWEGDTVPGKGSKGQEGMRWRDGRVCSAVGTDYSPLLLAAHIHSSGISLLFLPAIMNQSAPLETWCRSAVDFHSATAEQAARASHCKVSLRVSPDVCMLVCSVGQWRPCLYKLVLTGRDRGCAECDEGARGALSDSWRSKLPRVSSSLTTTALTRRWQCCHVMCTLKQVNTTAKPRLCMNHFIIYSTVQRNKQNIK